MPLTFPTVDIARYTDPESTRLIIPRFHSMESVNRREGALVHFYGDDYPTSFRGLRKDKSITCSTYWEGDETGHTGMLNLLTMLDEAFSSADARLILRTVHGLVSGLDPLEVGIVNEWSEPRVSGLVWSVNFTFNRVQYTVEV